MSRCQDGLMLRHGACSAQVVAYATTFSTRTLDCNSIFLNYKYLALT